MHVGEPEVASLVTVCQFCMIYPQAVEDRRIQIKHTHGVSRDVVAEVIRFPDCDPGLDPAPCEPHGEAARMVVAPIIIGCQLSLRVNRSPELAPPDNQG